MTTRYRGSRRFRSRERRLPARVIGGLPGTALVVLESPRSAGLVVGHGVVLYADGAALVAPHAAADLAAAELGAGGTGLALAGEGDARAQDRERDDAIRVLRALRLAPHGDAGRQVHDVDRALRLLEVLAAGAARLAGLPVEVAIRDHELVLADLVEDRDRDRARVHAAALLRRRNALPAVTAGLR